MKKGSCIKVKLTLECLSDPNSRSCGVIWFEQVKCKSQKMEVDLAQLSEKRDNVN
jgi:hypothetical protein